jgi:hypothetical protein
MNRSGWLTFSAVVLITAGIMRVIDAIWAFSYHGALPMGCRVRCWGTALGPTDGYG